MTYIFSLKGRYASVLSDFRKTPETAKEDKEICYSLKRERCAIVLRMSWNQDWPIANAARNEYWSKMGL